MVGRRMREVVLVNRGENTGRNVVSGDNIRTRHGDEGVNVEYPTCRYCRVGRWRGRAIGWQGRRMNGRGRPRRLRYLR